MSLSSLEPRLIAALDPLSGSNPCGESIRYTPLYDSLQDARANDDPGQLPEGVWQSDLKKADWPKVADLCLSTLSQKSKDVQVVAWLIEALFFMEGLEGLSRGLRLLNDLSQKFWETLYPLPEDGDLETRLSPYDWLDYHLPTSILSLTVTRPFSKDLLSYTLADWVDSVHLEGANRKQSTPTGEQGRPTFAEVVASLKRTPALFYSNLEEQTRSILSLSDLLSQTVGEKIGAEATLFYRLKGQLNLILKHLPTWKAQCFRKEEKSAVGPEGIDPIFQEIDFEEENAETAGPQNLSSRQAAYSGLRKIVEFLLAQDPHSPTPYLLRQALEWEEKSLPEIYAEWAHDPQALMFLMRFLGVKGTTLPQA